MRAFAALVVVTLLAACTTKPIPDGYTGPVAHIRDSSTPRSGTSVDFFYLAQIDGRRINDSLMMTTDANYGRGFRMTPVVIGRDVPAAPSTFTIAGRTHHAAPILALVNKVYSVSGETRFTPEPNQSYVVKGVLRDDYAAVWIEDSKTGAQVGDKIEAKGSTTLGILEK